VNNRSLVIFLLSLLALIWGTSFILIKKGLDAYSPLQVAAFRLTFAGLVLLPLLIRDRKKVKGKHIPAFIGLAIFGNIIPYFLFAVAETELDSGITGALNSLTPFFTLIISIFVFSIKSTTKQWMGILIGLVGAVFLITDGNPTLLMEMDLKYSLMVVAACVCYGISVNIIKSKLNDVSPILAASFPLVLSLIVSFPIILLTGAVDIIVNHQQGVSSLIYIGILGVVGTAVAISLFNRLVQLTSAVTASTVTYLIPIVALAWGLVVGESILWENFLSLMFILSGVYLIHNRKKTSEKSQ
jgi:drug/metabolite transporter (DMT)-like permease